MRDIKQLTIAAYKELLTRNSTVQNFTWWLVSTLAEVDNLTNQIISQVKVMDVETHIQLLFRFLHRASIEEIRQFSTVWVSREKEIAECI